MRRNPFSFSSAASARGPSPSGVSARMRAPGCRCGRIRSSGRPCSDSSVVSGSDQPSRAAARLNDDGPGTTSISFGSTWRAKRRADAIKERIARGEHADRPAAPLDHLAHGLVERARPRPHGAADERAARAPGGACRRTQSRRPRSARARPGERPSTPSSPMPTMDSQRRGAAVWAATGLADDMRHILILGGTSEARQLAGRLADRRDLKVTLSLAGRTAHPAAAAGSGAGRRLRRHRRASRPISPPSTSTCWSTRPIPMRRRWRPMPRKPRRGRRFRSSPCGGRPGRRLPTTIGPRSTISAARWPRWAQRRAACSSPSAARRSAPSRPLRSTTI